MSQQPENVMLISHLREVLGYACRQVAESGNPIIVQRYNRQEVVIVPLADWRYYQEMEALRTPEDSSEIPLEALDVLGPSR